MCPTSWRRRVEKFFYGSLAASERFPDSCGGPWLYLVLLTYLFEKEDIFVVHKTYQRMRMSCEIIFVVIAVEPAVQLLNMDKYSLATSYTPGRCEEFSIDPFDKAAKYLGKTKWVR